MNRPGSKTTASAERTGPVARLASLLSTLIDRLQLPEEAVLIGTSLAVGIATGLGAATLNLLIQAVSDLAFLEAPRAVPGLGRWTIALLPMVGGLVAGPLIYFVAREVKGHGVPEVMQAIALKGGRIRPIVAVVKAVHLR